MSTLSSASSDAEVRAAYDDNAAYAETGDVAAARKFATACVILLRREPESSGRGSSSLSLDKQSLRDELARARRFIAARANGGGNRSRRLSFENFRS